MSLLGRPERPVQRTGAPTRGGLRRPRRSGAAALVLVAVLAGGCGGGGGDGRPATGGGIAARVGDAEIRTAEVARLVDQSLRTGDPAAAPADRNETERIALLFLIRQAFLEQMARQAGIDGDRLPVVDLVARRVVPEEALEAGGTSGADLTRDVRASKVAAVLAAARFPDVAVSDVELRTYYDAHTKDFGAWWRAEADVAFFDDRALAAELARRVRAGEDYAAATGHVRVIETGELGEVSSFSRLPEPIRAAIAATIPGGVSDPVDVGEGREFAVVRVKSREDVPARSFDEARGDLHRYLVRRRQLDLFDEWFDEELGRAPVRIERRFGQWNAGLQLVVP